MSTPQICLLGGIAWVLIGYTTHRMARHNLIHSQDSFDQKILRNAWLWNFVFCIVFGLLAAILFVICGGAGVYFSKKKEKDNEE